jgi:hypothetical protein
VPRYGCYQASHHREVGIAKVLPALEAADAVVFVAQRPLHNRWVVRLAHHHVPEVGCEVLPGRSSAVGLDHVLIDHDPELVGVVVPPLAVNLLILFRP